MDMEFFLMRLWYSFNTSGFALEGGGPLDPSTISQRFMDANKISILNFQKLYVVPLKLSIILAASLSNDVIVRLNIS